MFVANFSAKNLPLIFDQASEFSIPFNVTNDAGATLQLLSLGYAARSALRGGDDNAVLLLLNTSNAGIVLGNVDPNLTVFVTATATSAFPAIVGAWDMYLDPNGVEDPLSFRIVYGSWMMNVGVTP